MIEFNYTTDSWKVQAPNKSNPRADKSLHWYPFGDPNQSYENAHNNEKEGENK